MLLWLAASCAWVSSLTALSSAAKLDHILRYNNNLCEKFTCKKIREAHFVKLIISDVSIITCYLNLSAIYKSIFFQVVYLRVCVVLCYIVLWV